MTVVSIILQMYINMEMVRLVVARSRRGEQARTAEERKKEGVRDLGSGKAWGRVTPLDR